jgi:hypothetical protein
MTETQAETSSAGSGGEDVVGHGGGDSGVGGSGAASSGADPGAVGRATVAGDGKGGAPKYTRAPGMPPPPDSLTVPVQTPVVAKGTASVSAPPASAPPIGGVPISVPPSDSPVSGGAPAVARASVRVPAAPVVPTSGAATGTIGIRSPQTTPGSSGSARVSEAVRAARKTVSAAVGRGPRRARLHVKRIDPWSVMKFSFAVSFVLFVVVIVATSVLYLALDAMGVFESVNKTLSDMIGATGSSGSDSFKITAKGVIGGAALLGLVNVVLFTALATLGAFIYNVCADLVGGIEVTLAEKE